MKRYIKSAIEANQYVFNNTYDCILNGLYIHLYGYRSSLDPNEINVSGELVAQDDESRDSTVAHGTLLDNGLLRLSGVLMRDPLDYSYADFTKSECIDKINSRLSDMLNETYTKKMFEAIDIDPMNDGTWKPSTGSLLFYTPEFGKLFVSSDYTSVRPNKEVLRYLYESGYDITQLYEKPEWAKSALQKAGILSKPKARLKANPRKTHSYLYKVYQPIDMVPESYVEEYGEPLTNTQARSILNKLEIPYKRTIAECCKYLFDRYNGDIDEVLRDIDYSYGNEKPFYPLAFVGDYRDQTQAFRDWLEDNVTM